MTAEVLMIMGTRLDFVLPSDDAPQIWASARDELVRLDKLFNRFDPSSDVSKYNAGGAPSAELADAIRLALCYRKLTCGLFDIAGGGPCDNGKDGFKGLDFGGFAKGYALGRIAPMLRGEGVRDAFVSFGGSTILAMGRHPSGDSWKVALKDPYSGLAVEEISLDEITLSTSGNTPAYTGHIVDPRTGKGNFERKMTTALCPDPLDAEILSTALMLADESEAEIMEKNFPNAELRLYLL
ncbi:MAG: FAD:protein FMN transferase [Bacteroidales bacterium]|nr:FAD:protein FMN transferase [Bacteroidales bacterium]